LGTDLSDIHIHINDWPMRVLSSLSTMPVKIDTGRCFVPRWQKAGLSASANDNGDCQIASSKNSLMLTLQMFS